MLNTQLEEIVIAEVHGNGEVRLTTLPEELVVRFAENYSHAHFFYLHLSTDIPEEPNPLDVVTEGSYLHRKLGLPVGYILTEEDHLVMEGKD